MKLVFSCLNDNRAYLKCLCVYTNLFTNKLSIVHDHNTRSKKQISFEDALEKMEGNILEQISNLNVEVKSTKNEFLNMKDVIIKRLQDENELLSSRCSKLNDKVVSLKSSVNQVEQYGRRNNIVITGIPDNIADDKLEDAVTSIMEELVFLTILLMIN